MALVMYELTEDDREREKGEHSPTDIRECSAELHVPVMVDEVTADEPDGHR